MTPEEWAEELWRKYGHNPVLGVSQWPGTIYAAATIRAAIAERDRDWRTAFDSYVLTGTEPMCRHCSGLLRDALDPRSCKHCRPLRALLAAGPTTERTE